MNDRTIVIGHKNPDTDSICSSLAYAELKTIQGVKGVLAGRAGNINPQTNFALQYFSQEPPKFISDLHPRVSDIMITKPITVNIDTPLLTVMKTFREKGVRFLPVVDGKNVTGTIVTLDLAEKFSSHLDPLTARKVVTSPNNIRIATDADVLAMPADKSERVFNVFVGAMSVNSFEKTVAGFHKDPMIVIVGDREEILRMALNKKVDIIIVTGGLKVDHKFVLEAQKKGIAFMSTPHDSATVAWLVKLSASAGSICSSEFTSASPHEKVDNLKRVFQSHKRGVIISDDNGIFQGLVTKSCFLTSPATKLILMDHNELTQAVDGADKAEIIEVVDHHRVGGLQTALPISFSIEPVGSTCTIVAEKYRNEKQTLSRETAGLLLSGVISDTITGKSPTTTPRDIEIMRWLEDASGVKKSVFSKEMFKASSILDQKEPGDVITNDFKEFYIHDRKIGVGQVEVVGFEGLEKVKSGLVERLNQIKNNGGYNLIALMVTDITHEVTLLLVSGDAEIVDNLELHQVEKNIYEMKGVLSRKKQVIPHLYNILAK